MPGRCAKVWVQYLPGSVGVSNESGSLYVVATPIGNLGDVSQRALDVLRTVDCVAVEDSRHSRRLLSHYSINARTTALHEHNERQVVSRLLGRLTAGDDVALISDAGTPLVSDPGHHLVRGAHERGIRVVPIPGASAVLAALSACGLPINRFAFEGFVPAAAAARQAAFERMRDEPRTLVLFEAPHRIVASVEDAVRVFGPQRAATLARELTKTHETIVTASLAELLEHLHTHPEHHRGEFVLVIEGSDDGEAAWQHAETTLGLLLAELPLKKAVALTARICGVKKNRVYKRALELTDPPTV